MKFFDTNLNFIELAITIEERPEKIQIEKHNSKKKTRGGEVE